MDHVWGLTPDVISPDLPSAAARFGTTMYGCPMGWLPEDFVAPPPRVELLDGRFHLRPIHPDDTDLDMVAVMGSRERLWSMFGEAWGWPPATMTAEQDRADLARHADEMTRNESFNFGVFDAAETALLGCIYIDPPEKVGPDAEISWWVVDDHVDSELDRTLADFVPGWIDRDWPLEAPRYVGRDISWSDWMLLDDC